MPLTITPADRLITQSNPNPDKRPRAYHANPDRPFEVVVVAEELFDSPAPASVDAGTEAAIADLEPIDEMPLAAVVRLYKEET